MDQKTALSILKAGYNVFLTGSAGTGKTFVLNEYINFLRERKIPVAITASTGIAATHINGMTIHAWSGIGVKDSLDEKDIKNLKTKKYLREQIVNAKVLIIDEISMLHKRQFELVDRITKEFRKSPKPFGGLQVVISGDFFQLPPVGERNELPRDKFAFMSDKWVEANLQICYLNEQYRQDKSPLNEVLEDIRSNHVSDHTTEVLKSAESNTFKEDVQPTRLYTHNVDVDAINDRELKQLQGKSRKFKASLKGNEKVQEILKKSVQASEMIELKVGARVMFVKNNPEQGYINGSLGVLTDYSENGFPVVRLYNGKEITVKQEAWSIEDEKGKTLASFSQIPLRLAWAITIHKSQGMTIETAEIDLTKTFEAGQGYVALSRLKSIEGLVLLGFNQQALKVDPLAFKADQRFQELAGELVQKIDEHQLEKEQLNFIHECGGLTDEKEIQKNRKKIQGKAKKKNTYEQTLDLVLQKMSIREMAEERGFSQGTLITHLIRIKELYPETDIEYLRPSSDILDKVKDQREILLKDKKEKNISLKPIFDGLKGKVSYDQIKLSLVFID